LAVQARLVSLAFLDGYLDVMMKPHVHLNEWRVEQVEALQAPHIDHCRSEQYSSVIGFFVNWISDPVDCLEFV
jgi:hypothetical protein